MKTATQPAPQPPRRQHYLEDHPPPPLRLLTVAQAEAEHPGLKGRLRQWIKRADTNEPTLVMLKFAIVRVGRSVFVDDVRLREFLHLCSGAPERGKAKRLGP